MSIFVTVLVVPPVVLLLLTALSLRMVQQYQRGVAFRFGRVLSGVRGTAVAVVPGVAAGGQVTADASALLEPAGR